MASTMIPNSRIAFGLYELDLQSEELWKSGFRVKLQSQPFKILVALLEQPGMIVTRDELQRRLWDKGTVVDFEHSLAAAINKIREALGDSADNPRFVETLARRGYRFIAPVSLPAPAELAPAAAKPDELAEQDESQDAAHSVAVVPAMATPIPPLAAPFASTRSYARQAAFAVAFCLGLAVALILWFFAGKRAPAVIPHHIAQLTHDGHLAVGPGSTEQNATIAAKVASSSHARRSTNSRRK